jgi:hypothetical protein
MYDADDRHATFLVRLTGPRYNPRTLEILTPNNESHCYWDNENKQFLAADDVDEDDLEDGTVIKVHLNKQWALGKFCHARAEIAHYFYHWRYNLRDDVKTALRHIHYLNDAKKEFIATLPRDEQDRYGRVVGWS